MVNVKPLQEVQDGNVDIAFQMKATRIAGNINKLRSMITKIEAVEFSTASLKHLLNKTIGYKLCGTDYSTGLVIYEKDINS